MCFVVALYTVPHTSAPPQDGPGEFKEAEGTGLGDGDTKGAKDISDQIKDEDQLLGAEQKDKPKDKEEQEKQEQGGKEEEPKVGC